MMQKTLKRRRLTAEVMKKEIKMRRILSVSEFHTNVGGVSVRITFTLHSVIITCDVYTQFVTFPTM